MRIVLPIVFVVTMAALRAQSDFITKEEYAAQLYKNPRGISCAQCHGEKGEGRLIAKYKHDDKERKFATPKINTLSYELFYKALNRRNRAMPRYFLTESEIRLLYYYLHGQEDANAS